MNELIIWKVRRKAGDNPDYFQYSVKRDDFPAMPMTAEQFEMMFPNVNAIMVPEAPTTAVIKVTGTLIL